MQVLTVLPQVMTQVLTLVVSAADETPEPEDVKAGWVAFGIFIGLILAVAFLGRSLVKQLRKVDAAEEAGLYDPSDKNPVPMPPVESAGGQDAANAAETNGSSPDR